MINLNHLLSLIQTDYTTIRVNLGGKKKYTYKSHDLTLQRGDYVVVVLPDNTPSIGKVMGVDSVPQIDETADFDYKWIVCKVDLEEYQARVNGEKAFYSAIEKAQHENKRSKAIEHLKELGVKEEDVKMLSAAILTTDGSRDIVDCDDKL